MRSIASTRTPDNKGRRLVFIVPSTNPRDARIGGGALIGEICDWPVAPDGSPLLLVASIPGAFIGKHASVELPPDIFISVFSYYSQDDYFLDQISYHGDQQELACIESGTTKVIMHARGQEIFQPDSIPAYRMDLSEDPVVDNDCGSYIGCGPSFLQNERLDLAGLQFALQIRSSDFPEKYSDVFGLPDATGYLYLGKSESRPGLFFAQVT
ncbi:hypothetical protein [Massilia sp. METH4]|uniref:hypothetical protein n=1 Tax=Massilia sp. METH4 TaxID=3123041 RepID=UPI0030D000B4